MDVEQCPEHSGQKNIEQLYVYVATSWLFKTGKQEASVFQIISAADTC